MEFFVFIVYFCVFCVFFVFFLCFFFGWGVAAHTLCCVATSVIWSMIALCRRARLKLWPIVSASRTLRRRPGSRQNKHSQKKQKHTQRINERKINQLLPLKQKHPCQHSRGYFRACAPDSPLVKGVQTYVACCLQPVCCP